MRILISILMAFVFSVQQAHATDSKDVAEHKLIGLGVPYTVARKVTELIGGVQSLDTSLLPASDNSINLGSSALRYASVFSTTANTAGLNFPTTAEEVVAGAGTTVADAGALSTSKHVHQLTGANGTVGWKFGTSVAGQFEILLNTTAGVPKIYAASGGTCNGGAADAACTLLSGIVAHLCYSTAADTWICS